MTASVPVIRVQTLAKWNLFVLYIVLISVFAHKIRNDCSDDLRAQNSDAHYVI